MKMISQSTNGCQQASNQPMTSEYFRRQIVFVSPTHIFFLCHLQRMMLPIKESLSLWACNRMQIRATDCQMSAVMVLWSGCSRLTQPGYIPVVCDADACLDKNCLKLMSPHIDLSVFKASCQEILHTLMNRCCVCKGGVQTLMFVFFTNFTITFNCLQVPKARA